jgi:hypothetical protein
VLVWLPMVRFEVPLCSFDRPESSDIPSAQQVKRAKTEVEAPSGAAGEVQLGPKRKAYVSLFQGKKLGLW